jgi:hypothetical protein
MSDEDQSNQSQPSKPQSDPPAKPPARPQARPLPDIPESQIAASQKASGGQADTSAGKGTKAKISNKQ